MKKNLKAEAGLAECNVILGWLFNFQCMTVALPKNKFLAWTERIKQMLTSGRTNTKYLKSTIGQLMHLSMVIPGVYHFLSCLRNLLWKAKQWHWTTISSTCMEDLQLMKTFIRDRPGKESVSTSWLTANQHTSIIPTLALFPVSLVSYRVARHAWRFCIPSDSQFQASNNLLKHMAAISSHGSTSLEESFRQKIVACL